ncbi:MAG: hypothetical protein K8I82_20425 [Anaerolineae bacterium]|nr:hypothetical protein [Anaerolineae bacterium]
MTKKRFALLLVIVLAVLCSLAAAVMLAMSGYSPRPLPPLTPIISPTFFFGFNPTVSDERETATTPAAVPIFATRAAIETQYAATTIALTPVPP